MDKFKEILDKREKILNDKFIKSCQKGDLDTVIAIYKKYYLEPNKIRTKIKNKFLSFLKISKPLLPPPILNLNNVVGVALETSVRNGEKNIINFFLNDKNFLKYLNQDELYKISFLSTLLNSAINHGDVELTKIILPLIKDKNEIFYHNIQGGFDFACYNGYLEVIKCFFQDKDINCQKLEIYEEKYNGMNSFSLISQGFNTSCQRNHLEMVKFFTDSSQLKNFININEYKSNLYVYSFDIVEYLILTLNMNKEKYIKKVRFMPECSNVEEEKERALKLFEKIESFKELNSELSINNGSNKRKIKL